MTLGNHIRRLASWGHASGGENRGREQLIDMMMMTMMMTMKRRVSKQFIDSKSVAGEGINQPTP